MSLRLEREFPTIARRASSPLEAGGASVELMRARVERARALRSRVVRRSVGGATARPIGGLLAAVACWSRGASHSLCKTHVRERECWARPAQGA
jgi:hypothetical protein